MKLKNGLISREKALSISSDYVNFVEGNFDFFEVVDSAFVKLKKGQSAITYHNGNFFEVKVTNVDNKSYQAVDGPVIRVSNGEYSWRVDGNRYAYPI